MEGGGEDTEGVITRLPKTVLIVLVRETAIPSVSNVTI